MSDIKTLKLTLKKKLIAPEGNQAGPLEVSQRIGKKIVYQVNQTKQPVAIAKPKAPITSATKPTALAPNTKKVKQPMSTPEEIIANRKAKTEKSIAWLIESYPKLFTPNEKKPVAINIHKQIRLENPTIAHKFIIRGLSAWIRASDYCQAIMDGVGRYDLEGTISGEITEEEKAHAKKRLEKLNQQRGK